MLVIGQESAGDGRATSQPPVFYRSNEKKRAKTSLGLPSDQWNANPINLHRSHTKSSKFGMGTRYELGVGHFHVGDRTRELVGPISCGLHDNW
jgi:hypothetical protein